MQYLVLLQQIFIQLVQMVATPLFLLVMLLLMAQTGIVIWQKQKLIWQRKQVRVWLPAFLFTVLKISYHTLLMGILGGFLASTLFIITGIFVEQNIIPYLWGVMLALFVFKRRFVCFAYAGGILVLLQFLLQSLFGNTLDDVKLPWNAILDFDGGMLLTLVAILHFVEAILVLYNGYQLTIPVYLRGDLGKTTIGTRIQMIWPIPAVMPVPVLHTMDAVQLPKDVVLMPDWWPVFPNSVGAETVDLLYQLIPMLVFISYHDGASYNFVQKHTQRVAIKLIGYSVILLLLILYGQRYAFLQPIAGLFSIVGHEAMTHVPNGILRKYVHIEKE